MNKLLSVLSLLLLVGCASPLYVTDNGVSIYLADEPKIEKDSFSIRFKFETPTDDSHLIQQIEMNKDDWTGIESFRVMAFGKTGVDHHHTDSTNYQYRRMTLMPGVVDGVDEGGGFAMLPSGWPADFNEKFRYEGKVERKIQGRIAKMRPEFQTIYYLEFDDGSLVWWVEGTDIRREWKAENK